jgi:superfamily II DNA or RNA helicase
LVKKVYALCPGIKLLDKTAVNPTTLPELKVELKNFQKIPVQKILEKNQGSLVADCGSGKTIMLLSVIFQRSQKTLIAVHTRDLAAQWKSRIEEFSNYTPGEISADKFQVKNIVVAMVQTLSQKNLGDDFFDQFGCVCLDEMHHCPAPSFNGLIQRFKARYRYGATATISGRSDGLDFLIPAVFGGSVEVQREKLFEQKHIMRPRVRVMETGFYDGMIRDYGGLLSAVTSNELRNTQILEDVVKEAKKDRFCLVLSERVDHARHLQDRFSSLYPGFSSECITGKDSKQRRVECIDAMRQGRLQVIFSTRIANEGLDIRNLDSIFLTCPIRSKSKLQQQIGRALRVAPGKSTPNVYDYYDKLNLLAASQFKARQEVYSSYNTEVQFVN